jgi:hypothetical protein
MFIVERGFIKLYRKSIDAGWIKNHKLWALWTWCLLKASHKDYDIVVGLQTVHLTPGQFIFGLKKASQEIGLTLRETRTRIEYLKKAGNLTIKTTNRFSIVSIVNWQTYQSVDPENDTQTDKQVASKRQQTRTKEYKNKKTPPDISAEMSSLVEIYSTELLEQVFSAISSTRKTNRITESVKLRFLQDCGKYPVHQVEAGLRVYLEKDYASQGKNEKYLLGIIRNQHGQNGEAPDPMARKSTGSQVLDDHYRSQGCRIIA